ncbi:hypothetical protein O7626_39550 [Micromonospora sp. WMMD1102]|uniref:hypothetical protein n=1 Tax=Micromonospora sp. WMMD1102 TaxID=3016105 RepID=UPI002414D470|nr:hypothetical protein [Micromonospora sp. WMMD1102]MDG4784335.1 hypothetical protein [Micromonospora sp. WMMD1102]MDG4784408.1 hypothetical protein [Micromonospora sp. WMMD1102]MDG4791912.1 hypothetical protein [Micromonospora sp. WMMD1102]
MTTDDFERRWRAAANADPGHATYREAVPGYRPGSAVGRRTGANPYPSEGPADPDALRPAETAEPYIGDPWTAEPDDAAVAVGQAAGTMTVVWRRPAGPPVTVEEIRQLSAAIERDPATDLNADAVRDLAGPAKLATDDAVSALRNAINSSGRLRRSWSWRRWWWR